MTDTKSKILEYAKECFFQHGYAATTISMVSRYANISRVTIHKHFSSKEVLFVQVVDEFFRQQRLSLPNYLASQNPFWHDTNALMKEYRGGIFEQISNTIVRTDLVLAGNTHCLTLIQQHKTTVKDAIAERLEQAINNGELSLEKIGLDIDTFATRIESIADGIFISPFSDNSMEIFDQLFLIYKAATLISN